MSMLAEKRTKKKWCLNPNGKEWSNDDSKFGQRMLEKMGWKKGCGLGVNLQGMKEHVKVSAKTDTKGLGCKNNSDTEWIHHQQNFEHLLSELACSSFEETRAPGLPSAKPVSLEEKSKKSRVRVHYQKFTRGKDVSKYSANDLACILGKKCSSVDSKSFEISYSCHTNTRNTSETDAEGGMVTGEPPASQSFNWSLLPKHRVKGQPEDKGLQEEQNDILKEISNVKEKSVAVMGVVQELKNKMEDNSSSNFRPESVDKVRGKRKRKHVKDSENSQEYVTETMISRPQEEVRELDSVAYAVEETDKVEKKKKRKKKKKDKKNKSQVDDENGKEDKELCIPVIDVTSDAEEIGNEELEHASMISKANNGGSKIKMKTICNAYETCISKEQKEHPKKKKRKKKMATQPLSEPDVNISSEIVSLSLQDNRDGINNTQRSPSFTSQSFSSYEEDPHQYDSYRTATHRKAIKKLHRKNVEIGFRGSNLDSIPGYGNL